MSESVQNLSDNDDLIATIFEDHHHPFEKRPTVVLSGEVEADELFGIAGHKGQPGLYQGYLVYNNNLRMRIM